MDPRVPSSVRVAFIVEGTRGDIQPYVALGLRLQARGNVVKFFSNVDHKSLFESFDLAYEGTMYSMSAAMSREDIKAALANGSAFRALKALADIRMEAMPEDIQRLFAALESFKPTVLVASYLSRVKALVWSVDRTTPLVNLELQVQLPVSDKAPGGLPVLPFGMNRVWFWLLSKGAREAIGKVKEIVKENLNVDLNGKLEVSWLLHFWYDIPNLPAPSFLGISTLVIPAHDEWPKENFYPCGFFIVDKQKQYQMMKDSSKGSHFGADSNSALTQFLSAGPPPVYLGWGSMVCKSPEWMVTFAVEALMHAGARGVLLGGWAGLGPDAVPAELQDFCREKVIFVNTAPHEWLFPQCACLVHHGGSGTTATSIRSGRPTVITPIIGDQFDFAESVNAIGCGVGLGHMSGLSPTVLGDAIKRCLEEDNIISKAKETGAKLCAEDGCGNFLRVFDEWLVKDFATGTWLEKHNGMLKKCATEWEAEELIALEPTCAEGYYWQSVALQGLGHGQEALEALMSALEYEPQNSLYQGVFTALFEEIYAHEQEGSLNSHAEVHGDAPVTGDAAVGATQPPSTEVLARRPRGTGPRDALSTTTQATHLSSRSTTPTEVSEVLSRSSSNDSLYDEAGATFDELGRPLPKDLFKLKEAQALH
ncbi:unnamed protein product [Polarella glacialis]|uniref:Glycosyltransferase family 28 N-terminal domain-containing protein n=1 Tax=Polarella glacialis TaxID=89957 RepID=A0A813IMT8_POLGL|nr:unnamed protein product [Polarella glacialis]